MEDDNYTAHIWLNRGATLYECEDYVIKTINAPTAIKMEISFASIPKTKYNDVTIQEED